MDTTTIDPQRDKVYAAEELAVEEFYDVSFDEPELVTPSCLASFVRAALDAAGWTVDSQPSIVLDVADDDERADWHEAKTGVIHLHSQLLRPWTVLHELAHWVDPRGGHGPRFCANYINLVCGSLGLEAGRSLRQAFEELDVEVDQEWLG